MNPHTKQPAHTTEPWFACLGDAGRKVNIECKGTGNDLLPVATLTGSDREANAARVVACVNVMAGLNPEALPECFAALKEAENQLATLLSDSRRYGFSNERINQTSAAQWKARAALAKLKGTP